MRVGLTGGIASGKSTVAGMLRDLGTPVFDADRIVAELYAPGAAGTKAVEALFGREALEEGGSVSKPELARRLFSDPAVRRRLETEIHPLVVAEIRRRFAEAERSGASIAVAEASQIFEGGYEKEFDRVIAVVAPQPARLSRGVARGVSREEMLRRIASQISEDEAQAKADDVIENSGTLEALRQRVAAVHHRWLADSG